MMNDIYQETSRIVEARVRAKSMEDYLLYAEFESEQLLQLFLRTGDKENEAVIRTVFGGIDQAKKYLKELEL